MKFLYTIILSVLLLSCANTNQSIVKSDDELSSTITLLFDKYVANDFEISDYYADDVIARVNNQELNGYENLIADTKHIMNYYMIILVLMNYMFTQTILVMVRCGQTLGLHGQQLVKQLVKNILISF